ncbi:hypothetical protein D1013_14135 [Euzebyella marina]|uniref:Alginate lyase domain-containing protein n=1 Tax=Euzebyella marina TaxID=1761453 RepID=A0A3G2L832_9FLAO|nr:Ig-like domain-containing protein [Euzebyella marina]AYN68438.1 hypothetical protein D1013_14135 [Euzebyella marina]
MKVCLRKIIQLITSLIILIFSVACSKDTDLLADALVNDLQNSYIDKTLLRDDFYSLTPNKDMVLDVLSNDDISDIDNIKIVETSEPKNGTVTINNDNTITYSPNTSNSEEYNQENDQPVSENDNSSDTPDSSDSSVSSGSSGADSTTEQNQGSDDTFEYTTETQNEDGSTTKQKASITITELSENVLHWKNRFDTKWEKDDESNADARSKSKNKRQEYYFLAHLINGQMAMWQATGDNNYLDTTLKLIDNTIKDAIPVGNGFLGWPTDDGTEYNLWDTFYWRHVATLIRIMHQSPNLRASGYQAKYEELLEFTEKNIWDRYESYGQSNIYRSRTHMASHWARLGMELFIVTGKQKYKDVFDNISHGKMAGRPSNLRDQLFPNPKNKEAYAWDKTWGVSKGSDMQDISHAGAIIHFWVLAEENGMYWNRADIDALLKTIRIFWIESDPSRIKNNVDGSGGYTNPGRLHEWFYLARFDSKLQKRLRETYNGKHLNFFGSQVLGIGALNEKILEDGAPVYPEQFR